MLMKLTNEDWQELANTFKDNYVMTRLLRERYSENKPKNEGDSLTPGQKNNSLTFVQFGQTPQDRQEIFSKFTGFLRKSCTHKYCLAMMVWILHQGAITGGIVQRGALRE